MQASPDFPGIAYNRVCQQHGTKHGFFRRFGCGTEGLIDVGLMNTTQGKTAGIGRDAIGGAEADHHFAAAMANITAKACKSYAATTDNPPKLPGQALPLRKTGR